MSKRKFSKRDYQRLNNSVLTRKIKPGGRTEIRAQGPPRTRRKGGR